MKKGFLLAVGFLAFQAVSAQEKEASTYKPTAGTVATEVSLVGGLNNADYDLNGGAVKFRYFLKEDLALRIGLGLGSEKTEVISGTEPNQLTTTAKNSNTTFKAGIEKHFAGTNKLSTYAGADLIIAMGNTSSEASNQNGNFNNLEQKNSKFGIGVFTGADYYIAPKLFLGVEVGLSFLSSQTKDAEFSNKTGNVTTSSTTPGSKGTDIGTGVNGGIRIGYQF